MESNEKNLEGLFRFLTDAGAGIMGSPLGVPTALHFGDPVAEHHAARTGPAVIDLSHLGSIRVGGGDRAAFLHRMVTSDVSAMMPGESRPSAFLTTKGKFVAVFDLICEEDSFVIVTPREDLDPLLADLTKYAILDDVAFTDESVARASIHLSGIEDVRQEDMPDHVLVRKNRTGEPGCDLHMPADRVVSFWKSLVEADTTPVGHMAHETLRIEAGIPRAGAELTGDIGPLEAGMPELVSLTKGCYRGQEVVAKMHYIGKPPKRIVGLGIDDADEDAPEDAAGALPAPGDPIMSDGKNVGRVTSAAYGPTLGRRVALGLVRARAIEEGAPVTCETARGILVMRFEETPFR
ncbi:MAG: folate-binding protein YgfZ [Gemmatimonadetes bacterium]|nr:folate-binding protein YgfZ [Gemmatimonadota bacterium]